MKFKTTKKAIKENYGLIIEVGYCDLQYLLGFKTPIAYTCGVYGLNADIYDIDGVAIVTGYRSFGDIKPRYEIIEKYNRKAEKLRYKEISMEEMKRQTNELLNEFIAEVIKCLKLR